MMRLYTIILLSIILFPSFGADKYIFDDKLRAPYTNCLTAMSDHFEKAITMEMLGPNELFTIYNNDIALEKAIHEFQELYKIPSLDYEFCLAGAMTLNLLIEIYIKNNSIVGSFRRELKKLHHPDSSPDIRNMWGIDVVEVQLMYNAWASQNYLPPIVSSNGQSGGLLLEVDGFYGQFTEAAVLNFQKSEELLENTGIINKETWKLLYIRTYRQRNQIIKQLISYSDLRFP